MLPVVHVQVPEYRDSHLEFRDHLIFVFDHFEKEATDIRDAIDKEEERWFEALKLQNDQQEIAVLTLATGFSWDPGPRWFVILSLIVFNIVFDLLVLIGVRNALKALSAATDAIVLAGSFLLIVAITATAYASFLIASVYFLHGYGASYWLLLIGFPLSVLGVLALLFGLLWWLVDLWEPLMERDGTDKVLQFLALIICSVVLLTFLAAMRDKIMLLGWPALEYPAGKHAIPYALASCAVAPGVLTLVALAIATLAKFGGPIIITPLELYLKSVLAAPSLLGVTLLALPSVIVEVVYRLYDWMVHYHSGAIAEFLQG